MKDVLGQEINIGDDVLWASANRSGFKTHRPLTVKVLGKERVGVKLPYRRTKLSYFHPTDCVVVTKLIQQGENV